MKALVFLLFFCSLFFAGRSSLSAAPARPSAPAAGPVAHRLQHPGCVAAPPHASPAAQPDCLSGEDDDRDDEEPGNYSRPVPCRPLVGLPYAAPATGAGGLRFCRCAFRARPQRAGAALTRRTILLQVFRL